MSDAGTIALANTLKSNDKLATFIHRNNEARKVNECNKFFFDDIKLIAINILKKANDQSVLDIKIKSYKI